MPTKIPPLIDPSLSLKGETARKCLIFLDQMASWEQSEKPRQRKLKESDLKSREASAKMLCANLLQFWKRDSKSTFGILRSKKWYSNNRIELGPHITQTSLIRFLDFLIERNLVEKVSDGRKHPDAKQGIPTQIRAKQSLIDFLQQGDVSPFDFDNTYPQIVLKSDKRSGKEIIDFEKTDLTNAMESKITRINNNLLNHWADIAIPHEDLIALKDKGVFLEETLYRRRKLHRVFNNSTFEDGGRFYGGWWQGIPSRLRPFITINGKETVELDYSSIHPRMLYAHIGMECPDDPYDVGLDPKYRDLIKKAFNALINASGRIQQFNNPEDGPVFDEDEIGMSWNEFLKHIKSYHPKLKGLFGTGIGLKFQRIDSDIAEATMLHFARQNIPVLPVHDSFIMHHGYEDELRSVMTKEFENEVDASIPIKIDRITPDQKAIRQKHDIERGLYPNFDPTTSIHEITNDLDVLLDRNHEYGKYQERLDLFWANRKSSSESLRQELKDEQDPKKFAKLELDRLRRN